MSLHPSVAAVRRAVRRGLSDLGPGEVVVVACSGGPDSLALLAATVAEAREPGWHVAGITVDHGLQEGSGERAERVVAQMATLGAAETLTATVRVDGEGLGPEAAARQARYAVLDELGERLGAATILLGHTRDDQAETVLLGLARGGGPRSLVGMRRTFDRYRRPLLDVSRTDTVTACQVEGIEYWTDPHNADPAFTRARVRHQVLPMLERELGPGIAETLARTADQLRDDADLIDDLTDDWLARHDEPLDAALLAGTPSAVRRRVLHRAILGAGAPASEVTREHVLSVDALVTDWHGQRWIDLPGHLRAERSGGTIRLVRSSQ
jgi:tRNA(Ile)-lysidine synthase